jgi:hypothetical protein
VEVNLPPAKPMYVKSPTVAKEMGQEIAQVGLSFEFIQPYGYGLQPAIAIYGSEPGTPICAPNGFETMPSIGQNK